MTGSIGSCTVVVTDPGAVKIHKNEIVQGMPTYPNNGEDNYTEERPNNGEWNNGDNPNEETRPPENEPPQDQEPPEEPPVEEEPPEEEPKIYAVKFVVDDETVKTRQVEEGKLVGEIPENPTKFGYTFKGWYCGDTEVTNETRVIKDMTIVATWDEYTFKLALINDDEYSPNRTVTVYKNGKKIDIETLYSVYSANGGEACYKLGTWNTLLNAVKVISYRQVELANKYMIELGSGLKLYASMTDLDYEEAEENDEEPGEEEEDNNIEDNEEDEENVDTNNE